ncbi:cob(I)yrinic acid a,c-diamide adenosyltransferase [Candidatus Micrarchaeota archaeon]|nr:MAG: cob(I)yrinic acid a,c-diamide adenosyltransferase [Candidatus Micrarchaeota archaeon]
MPHLSKGIVQVYTGNGKGKTTSAIGLAVRARGSSLNVALLQFLKSYPSGELKSLKKLGVYVKQYGRPCPALPSGEPDPSCLAPVPDKDKHWALEGLKEARKTIMSGQYDLVILDELNVAVHMGYISIDDVLSLIKEKPKQVELVITGRKAKEELINAADLVTEMREIKHSYQKGMRARRGIEY